MLYNFLICQTSLLGNSQTFIGVLTTIVVLCVVTSSGNFLYDILTGIADPAIDKINKFSEELKTHSTSLKENEIHKKFLVLLNKIKDNKTYTNDLQHIANQYRVLYDININEFTNRFNGTFLVPLETRIKRIKQSKEQTFAPLFVFGYCIFVFICDEIASWFPSWHSHILSIVAIFTILSVLFLSGIWYKFHSEFHIGSDPFNVPTKIDAPVKINFHNILLLFFIRALLPYLTILAFIWAVNSYVIHVPMVFVRLSIVFGIIVPLVVLGRHHLKIRTSLGDYSHSFLLWHFTLILALSITYALVLFLPLDFLATARIPYSAKQWEIQGAITVFVILFGIILPFGLPYRCYKGIEEYAESKYQTSYASMSEAFDTLNSEIDFYIHDLREWVALEYEIDYELASGLDCCFTNITINTE